MQDIHSITERTEEVKNGCVFNECLYFIELNGLWRNSSQQKMLYSKATWVSGPLVTLSPAIGVGSHRGRVHALSDCSEAFISMCMCACAQPHWSSVCSMAV